MRTGVLLFISTFMFCTAALSQCTPDPLYADSVFGVWPDTMTNFPAAELGMNYEAQIDLIVPASTADVPSLPLPFPLPIDSGAVTEVVGLPPGITYLCNSQTEAPCTYLPAQQGCALLVGVPTEAGVYDIEISITAYLPFTQVDQSFGGYRIVVSEPESVSENELLKGTARNVPNPFESTTDIQFQLSQANTVTINVMNMLGDLVYEREIKADAGMNSFELDCKEMNEGIYLYSLTTDKSSVTKRMVLKK